MSRYSVHKMKIYKSIYPKPSTDIFLENHEQTGQLISGRTELNYVRNNAEHKKLFKKTREYLFDFDKNQTRIQ